MAERIRKLAIVGASARAAAFSALRAGYEVVAADLFADADLRQTCPATRIAHYPHGFVEWLAATECDGWLYTGALENYPQLIDRLAAIRPLLGTSGEPLRQCRDPLLLQNLCRASGLLFPETRVYGDDLPRDGSWLVKSYRGASGIGVSVLEGDHMHSRSSAQQAFFQRRVEGVPAAAVFAISEREAHLLGVTGQLVGDSRLGAKRWQYAGSVGPLRISSAIESQLAQFGEMLRSGLRLRGLVGADLLIAGDRLWLVEINPRYTASVEVVERLSGVHAVAAHVASCTLNLPSESHAKRSDSLQHGKAILFAKRDVVISPALNDWAMNHSGLDQGRETSLADIPAAGERIAAGHPVMTVLISAPATDYNQRLSEWLSTIESKLYDS
jgi:predicted ATP-grasp superfamily ATP-dependent carboligase